MPDTIWKFPLEIIDEQTIHIPAYYKILCAQLQGEIPCLWILVDPEQSHIRDEMPMTVYMRGTGHNCDGLWHKQYVGTVQDHGVVLHIFVD